MTGEQPAVVPPRLGGNRSFTALWWGQGVSQVGSQISLVALPLVAVVTLGSGPFEVAAVAAAEYLPSLLFGLVAGVLVDTMDQRLVMIVTDLLRAAVLLAVPLAHLADAVSVPLLCAVAFLLGLFTLFFDLSYQSALPRLVEREQLRAANGRLETTRSASTAAGPPAGSALVQTFGAPLAVIADAVSYLVSSLLILRVRLRPRTRSVAPRTVNGLRGDLAAGLRQVRRDPRQRAVIAVAATSNAATVSVVSLLPLWLINELGLPAWSLGLVLSCGAVGGVVAGFGVARLPQEISPKRAIGVGLVVAGGASVLVPLATGPAAVRLAMVCLAECVGMACLTVIAVTCMSWRQSVTPEHLLAKVISVARTVNFGVLPLTTLAGGALASAFGIRPVLFLAAALVVAAPLWMVGVPDDERLRDEKEIVT
ncbi:MFS transporter [Streptomyces sp. SP18CS02]|uniref:MFS transporter n=1 Tax=Streptomyces sp. SP18CS02 TaxID=3002531 RepID=UPI002E763D28|nr:MFS transporter [Streptomyces sp. SP18CS02]MEE1752751.1 MFS transporter [Streptomyces sp. SP18CS02]